MSTYELEECQKFAANNPAIFGQYGSVDFQAQGASVYLALGIDDEYGDAIIGSVVVDPVGGTYLGCQTCLDGIDTFDAGMCASCRQELAFREGAWS